MQYLAHKSGGCSDSNRSCEALNGAGREKVDKVGFVSPFELDVTLWLSMVVVGPCVSSRPRRVVVCCGVLFTDVMAGRDPVRRSFEDPTETGLSWARCRYFENMGIRSRNKNCKEQEWPRECGVEGGGSCKARAALIRVDGRRQKAG